MECLLVVCLLVVCLFVCLFVSLFVWTLLLHYLIVRWDEDIESLSATLYQARPDVFPMSTSSPIANDWVGSLLKFLFLFFIVFILSLLS
jgi:hypothetical protein